MPRVRGERDRSTPGVARIIRHRSIGSAIAHYVLHRGMGRALRHRDYALFALFGWQSTIGLWVQRVGVQWLTWELTGSFAWLGAVALVEAVCIIVMIPLAGSLADSFDRLKLARIAQTLAMVVTAIMAAVTLMDAMTVTVLLLLIAINGLAEGIWTPTRLALIPNLVPREDMPAAVGTGAMLFNVSQFIGPAVAGVLILTLGVGFTFAVNSLSYALFLGALFCISARYTDAARRSFVRGAIISDFLEGLRYVARHRALGPLLALSAGGFVLLRPYRELLAGFADELFAQGVQGLSMLASASGLGAAASALLMANFARTRGLVRLMLVNMFASVLLLVAFVTVPSFTVVVFIAGALAFCLTIVGISTQVLVQNTVPDELRGRIMGLWGIQVRGGVALGAWGMGMVTPAFGFDAVLIAAAALFMIGWLYVVLLQRPPLRSLEARDEPAGQA